MSDQNRNALGTRWDDAEAAAQQWAFSHGYLLKLTRDERAELDALWEQANGDRDAFVQLLEANFKVKAAP